MRKAVSPLIAALAAAAGLFPGRAHAGTEECPWVGSSYLARSCGNGLCDGVAPDVEDMYNCPRDCNPALIMSFYSEDTWCGDVVRVEHPTDTTSAQAALMTAVSQGHTVNFSGAGHSGNQIICNDGVVIKTDQMKDIWGIESFEGEEVVHFEAGVNYWELNQYLEAHGKALNYAMTWLGEITPAGAIATGVHGSAVGDFSSISHYVRSIELIHADGTTATYTQGTTGVTNPELWRALRANLGALGMMTNIRLAIRPRYSLKMRIDYYPESVLLEPGGLASLAQGCDFIALQWFPGPYTETLMRHCAWETTEPEVGTAANILIAPDIDPGLQQDFRDNMQLASCYDTTMYSEEQKRRDFWVNSPPLVVDPNASMVQHVTEIVGPWNHMINWMIPEEQVDFSQTDWEVAIPMDQFDVAINELHSFFESQGMAFGVVGAFIRLDQADDSTILGGNALGTSFEQGEQIVHLEIPVFIPWDHSDVSRAQYESRYWEMARILLDNYDVRPHWGKNQNWVFSDDMVRADNALRRARFQTFIDQMDPNGVFSRVHLARAGFTWPNGPTYDTDGDGLTDQQEVDLGSDPDVYNGLHLRIDNADGSGSCDYMDTYSEMTSRWNAPEVNKDVTQSWEFNCSSHNFTSSCYAWNPTGTGGYTSWGARFSGQVYLDQAGTWCFSAYNASTGKDIVGGRNACSQTWVDQTMLAEVGYDVTLQGGGPSPDSGCVTIAAPGWHGIDLVSRNHDANGVRSFIFRPRYCFGGTSSCAPSTIIPQHILVPEGTAP